MIEIENDQARNLFIIRYHGRIGAAETEKWVAPLQAGLEQMRPGFGLLTDLTDLEWMDVACAPHIEAVMDFANSKGVAAVVRVIPDPTRDIGLQIMSRFHYSGKVQVLTTKTLEEAMRILFD
jgi:anti-anti-sigma regulatory factor